MIQLATMYEKQSELYGNDPFWIEALNRSGGTRIFSDTEIPEEWQVKQFICQTSTTVKQKQKATAGVQVLSPDDMRLHLKMHLQDVPNLPGDIDILTTDILGLAIDLSVLKQMDVLKVTGKKSASNQAHRRAIVAACKLVGSQAPKSLLSSITQSAADTDNNDESEVAPDGEDSIEQAILEEEEQQDIFDTEHNNNDEEIDDLIKFQVHALICYLMSDVSLKIGQRYSCKLLSWYNCNRRIAGDTYHQISQEGSNTQEIVQAAGYSVQDSLGRARCPSMMTA